MKPLEYSMPTQLKALDLLDTVSKQIRLIKRPERAEAISCFLRLLRCEIPHYITED